MAMKDKLVEKGLDDDYVADKLKDFIENKNAPHSVTLHALNKASDLLGHNKKIKSEDTKDTVIMLSDADKKQLKSKQVNSNILKN